MDATIHLEDLVTKETAASSFTEVQKTVLSPLNSVGRTDISLLNLVREGYIGEVPLTALSDLRSIQSPLIIILEKEVQMESDNKDICSVLPDFLSSQ